MTSSNRGRLLEITLAAYHTCSLHSVSVVSHFVLFKRYGNDPSVDMMGASKQGSPNTPILLIYTSEKDAAEKLLFETVSKKQVQLNTVSLSGSGPSEAKKAKKAIQAAMNEVSVQIFTHFFPLPPTVFNFVVNKDLMV